jgi:hypothetical protein
MKTAKSRGLRDGGDKAIKDLDFVELVGLPGWRDEVLFQGEIPHPCLPSSVP